MSNIKTRNVVKGTIKTFDKSLIVTQKIKDNIVNIKEKNVYSYSNDESVEEYASNKIASSSRVSVNAFRKVKQKGNEAIIDTKDNFSKAKQKVKSIKTKLSEKKKLKKAKKSIKISNKIAKKETQKLVQESLKNSQKAVKLAKESAKKTYQITKMAVKATISSIKAIIAATKALLSLLIAGGWIAMIVIIVICLIGLIVSSIFGIFFAGTNNGSKVTMSSVVSEINQEMSDKIEKIKRENFYDDYIIHVDRSEWKDVLAIYAVLASENNQQEIVTLDTNKVLLLKRVFWDMNTLSFDMKQEMVDEEEYINGTLTIKKVPKNILHINIIHKTVEEMQRQYQFTLFQSQQLKELLSDEYADLWDTVIYGNEDGRTKIVNIALSQVGNVGGEPYWRWYGFNERHEWCAIFVSWVFHEAGESDRILKFAGVQTGIDYFKAKGTWKESSYVPEPGDVIFFDWEQDGKCNHVGIVEKVENNKIYTIEGNSTDDMCRQQEYEIGSKYIYGYGRI